MTSTVLGSPASIEISDSAGTPRPNVRYMEIVESTVCDDRFEVSNAPGRVNVDVVASFLAEDSYWAKGRPRKVIEASIANSTCFGAYAKNGSQAGFARLVTDSCTFAWVCDVFVLPEHRGFGLGKALMQTVVSYTDRLGIGQLVLATADAHGLYAQNGFAPFSEPAKWMHRRHPTAPKRP